MDGPTDPDFPCSLALQVPLPTSRLASTALQALQVDPELSPLVRRQLSVVGAPETPNAADILRVEYKAATNRMLRVAVNSFMDSLKLVLEVMEQLDVDVITAAPNQETD
ncbi:EKC/KEOPS complex subunit PCC1 [Paramyrothecium foliicola]|nr:EKC/KEOPS complex subunit PCC1 [Paramyrothecium foliicola]